MDNMNERICGPRLVKGYLDRVTGPKLEAIGMTPATAPFLKVIAENEGISLRELSEILVVDKAHTTRVVSKLIDDGFVVNMAQGPAYSLHLTPKGKEISGQVKSIVDDAWKSMFRDLTPEEHETMKVIMSKVANVIKEAAE